MRVLRATPPRTLCPETLGLPGRSAFVAVSKLALLKAGLAFPRVAPRLWQLAGPNRLVAGEFMKL